MSDNTYDIRGLTPEGARQYIIDVMTHLKLLENQLQNLINEENKWRERIKLATEHGRTDLLTQAQAELEHVVTKKTRLEQETNQVRLGVEKMRETLASPGFQAEPGHQYAETLMAELGMEVDTPRDTLTPEFDAITAEEELERLKRDLGSS